MAFTIEITEVGEAEFPLIAVLHHSIHGQSGFESVLRARLSNEKDVLVLMAHLEGNPLGYAIGFGRSGGRFEVFSSGVLPQYAGENVQTQLDRQMEMFAKARGYREVVAGTGA